MSRLSFTYVGGPVSAEQANILIDFVPMDGPLQLGGSIVGLAESPMPSGTPPSSFLRIDSAEFWKPFGYGGEPGDFSK